MKDIRKINHCGNIQMFAQIDPRLYKMLKYHLDDLFDNLDCIYCDLPLKAQSDCEDLIKWFVLDLLQDLQDLYFSDLENGKTE